MGPDLQSSGRRRVVLARSGHQQGVSLRDQCSRRRCIIGPRLRRYLAGGLLAHDEQGDGEAAVDGTAAIAEVAAELATATAGAREEETRPTERRWRERTTESGEKRHAVRTPRERQRTFRRAVLPECGGRELLFRILPSRGRLLGALPSEEGTRLRILSYNRSSNDLLPPAPRMETEVTNQLDFWTMSGGAARGEPPGTEGLGESWVATKTIGLEEIHTCAANAAGGCRCDWNLSLCWRQADCRSHGSAPALSDARACEFFNLCFFE